MTKPQHFAFLLLPDFTQLALACAIEPLRIANMLSGRDLYRWTLISEDGNSQVSSSAIAMQTHQGFCNLVDCDRLFVVSGLNVHRHATPEVINYVRRQGRHGTPLGAICSGAYVLARGGLLDGHPCAVHWAFHDVFAEAFPDVELRRCVFVADDPVVSASGGPAASDLVLHLIRARHGSELAGLVADQMVYAGVRPDASQQRLPVSARFGVRNAHIAKAFDIMENNLETPMDSEVLAQQVGVTIRQLQRLFHDCVGRSPYRVYTELRLERARTLLRQTDLPVIEVALACGFKTTPHFARAYRSSFGYTPRQEATF